MGISCFQLSIYTMNQQKSKIAKQQMAIQDQRDLVNGQLNHIIQNSENWYKDPDVKILQAQDDQLDSQLESLETQLQAITANLEAQEKQKEENIKKEVPQLA